MSLLPNGVSFVRPFPMTALFGSPKEVVGPSPSDFGVSLSSAPRIKRNSFLLS